MSTFQGIMEGEFENNADLFGASPERINELLGHIARLPKDQQAGAFKRAFKKYHTIVCAPENSRRVMESKFAQLPKDIQEGLNNKRLQMVDTRFYTVKEISGKNSIDVFQGTDNKSVGLSNLANQKLDKDKWFLLYAIQVRYGQLIETKDISRIEFALLPPYIRNGEFEFEVGGKKVIELMDTQAFDTRGLNNVAIGHYTLESPKLIEPQVEIKMPMKWISAADAASYIRVTLIGTMITSF